MFNDSDTQDRRQVLAPTPQPRPRPGPGAAVAAKPAPGRRRWWIGLVVVAVVVGLWVLRRPHVGPGGPGGAARRGGGGPAQAVPVVAGTVVRKDVPIYLDGLGTVQAYNTVTVHTRVDGQLEKIAYVEGQDVRRGDLLAQIDPRPFKAQLEQAQAKKAQDEAQLANGRVELRRDTDLLASKIIAQSDFDAQKYLVDQYQAAVQADQAAIDNAQVQLDYTTITSPLDGRTGMQLVDQGNIVHATDTTGLVVITQLRPIEVIFTLPEQALTELRHEGMTKAFPVMAVDRDNQTVLDRGHLLVVDNQIDTTTATLRLKATFPNANLQLWPGQFVNARLLLTTRTNGLVVPAAVLQRGPDGAFAFVIKPDATVAIRPVKVARIEAGEALIDDGLRLGERVVVEGQYRLQAGSHIRLAKSAKGSEAEP